MTARETRSGEPNWATQTVWTGDCLDVMQGMNSGSVELVYLDPPFNSGADYAAPAGSQAAGAAFDDRWGLDDIDLAWQQTVARSSCGLAAVMTTARLVHSDGMAGYLTFVAKRLMEIRRLLSPTGSVYLHCDPTASHYLKAVMDAVFGPELARNEIVWCYTGPQRAKQHWPRKHDIIHFYANPAAPLHSDAVRVPSKWNELGGYSKAEVVRRNRGKVPEDWWQFTFGPNSRERCGYPTQKPLKLLERIIAASSGPGSMVLDPFCGSGTSLIAAARLGRQWAGIDISPRAAEIVEMRMQAEAGMLYDGVHRSDVPERTDNADTNAPA